MKPLHTECISCNCTKKQMQGMLKIIPPLPSFLGGKTSHGITSTHILQYYPWIWFTVINWEITDRFWGSSHFIDSKLPDMPKIHPIHIFRNTILLPLHSKSVTQRVQPSPRINAISSLHTHRACVTAQEGPCSSLQSRVQNNKKKLKSKLVWTHSMRNNKWPWGPYTLYLH